MGYSRLLAAGAMVLVTGTSVLAADDGVYTAPSSWKWLPSLQVEGDIGIGHDSRDIALPQAMIPLWENDKSMLFTDLRYRFDNEQSQEYNLGLGFRREITPAWFLGGYGFFDKLSSQDGYLYTQGTFGLEALSVNNDARVNVYIPEGTTHVNGSGGNVVISGGQISVDGGYERALPGEDFELGQRLPFNFADVRIYGGGYRYTAENFGMESGPRGRFEVKLNDHYIPQIPFGAEVTLGGEIEHDQVRGTNSFAVLKLRIPFGSSPSRDSTDSLDERMNTFIQRDIDVVEKAGGAPQAAQIDGITVSNVVNINANGNIASAVSGANPNTLFLVDGSAGTIAQAASNIAMPANSVMLGGGTAISVAGAATHATIPYTFSGSAPTIDQSANGGYVLQLNTNTLVQNVTLANAPGFSANIPNSSTNVTMHDMTIASADDAVSVGNSTSAITLDHMTISNATTTGIDARLNTTGLTISNDTISAGSTSIDLRTPDVLTNVVLSNDSLTAGSEAGVDTRNSTINGLSVNNVLISTGAYGYDIRSATLTGLSGSGNTISGGTTHCYSAGAIVTGSLTYNSSSTCP